MSESEYKKYCQDNINNALKNQGIEYIVTQDDKISCLFNIYIDKIERIKEFQNAYNSGLEFHNETLYRVKFRSMSEYDSKTQELLF